MNFSKFNNFQAFKTISRYFNTSRANFVQLESKVKPDLRLKSSKNTIGPFGWFLLTIPAATFGLGTWQVQRKQWKEDLIRDLHERKHLKPVPLPTDPDDLKKLEYCPVRVRGTFLHDKEVYLGPRTLLIEGDASTRSSLISKGQQTQGYLVITPFKLSDRDETILVNRGWVSMKTKDSRLREKGQVKGEVDIIGIVRLHENRPPLMPKTKEGNNIYLYRDLEKMSEATGAQKVFLDITNDTDIDGGPVGGQTRISLRNEHLSYILTWYSLCGITSFMWYRQFLIKRL